MIPDMFTVKRLILNDGNAISYVIFDRDEIYFNGRIDDACQYKLAGLTRVV